MSEPRPDCVPHGRKSSKSMARLRPLPGPLQLIRRPRGLRRQRRSAQHTWLCIDPRFLFRGTGRLPSGDDLPSIPSGLLRQRPARPFSSAAICPANASMANPTAGRAQEFSIGAADIEVPTTHAFNLSQVPPLLVAPADDGMAGSCKVFRAG
jgi:hypothetical protein